MAAWIFFHTPVHRLHLFYRAWWDLHNPEGWCQGDRPLYRIFSSQRLTNFLGEIPGISVQLWTSMTDNPLILLDCSNRTSFTTFITVYTIFRINMRDWFCSRISCFPRDETIFTLLNSKPQWVSLICYVIILSILSFRQFTAASFCYGLVNKRPWVDYTRQSKFFTVISRQISFSHKKTAFTHLESKAAWTIILFMNQFNITWKTSLIFRFFYNK